jgi:hypothetical protein
MALVLTLREGEDFVAGERRFVVQQIVADMEFVLRDDGTGKLHTVTDEHAVEIMDDVFVSAGDMPPSATVRVALSAPRSIRILRGECLREKV